MSLRKSRTDWWRLPERQYRDKGIRDARRGRGEISMGSFPLLVDDASVPRPLASTSSSETSMLEAMMCKSSKIVAGMNATL